MTIHTRITAIYSQTGVANRAQSVYKRNVNVHVQFQIFFVVHGVWCDRNVLFVHAECAIG